MDHHQSGPHEVPPPLNFLSHTMVHNHEGWQKSELVSSINNGCVDMVHTNETPLHTFLSRTSWSLPSSQHGNFLAASDCTLGEAHGSPSTFQIWGSNSFCLSEQFTTHKPNFPSKSILTLNHMCYHTGAQFCVCFQMHHSYHFLSPLKLSMAVDKFLADVCRVYLV
jgi:hypothetical protein